VSAAILLVPTFLMGGTLPVLSRYLARRRGVVGSAVGILYGLNTLGAAAGAFLSGFVFIRLWGTQATIHLAVGINMALAAAFVGLHSLAGGGEASAEEAAEEPPADAVLGRVRLGLLLLAVGISGFVSFSYEVVWTRLLALVFETTVHAFSVMLTTFLLGLGLGGAVAGALVRRGTKRGYWRLYGYLEALIGLCGLATIPLFLPPPLGYSSFAQLTMVQFVRSAMVMIVPTTLMGAAFPIACHLYAAGVRQTGESVGRIYVANTVGAVLGALLTGFWLVRMLGSQGSIVFGSLLMVASGALVLAVAPRPERRRALLASLVPALILVAVALGLWGLIPGDAILRHQVRCHAVGYGDPDLPLEVLGYDEGVEGSVIALRHPDGTKLLSVGTTIVAG
ncbi:MAG: fused MFS/spermidine synthase, partial [Candidatus Brocadiae bacterium]|nr:fused MFS/spermidine synthase [Candidatus Brocadiia bacterium]